MQGRGLAEYAAAGGQDEMFEVEKVHEFYDQVLLTNVEHREQTRTT